MDIVIQTIIPVMYVKALTSGNLKVDVMETSVYFYRNSEKPGDWTPFGLNEADGKHWNIFCTALSLSRPEDPNPYFMDYLSFVNELMQKAKNNHLNNN
jgi:hypothetical protein